MPRLVIWTILISLAAVAFGWFTLARADLREAAIEARYGPVGEIVQVDGQDIHVIVEGEGPDLVLIHGAGGNARDFTYQFTGQLTDRFRVFSVDRPGFGWSGRARAGLDAAFTSEAESPLEQARILSNAVAQLGADRPMVLGHSYGGAVAMAWALEAPTSGVVILSGATMPWPGKLKRYYRVFGSPIGSGLGGPLVSAYASTDRVESALEDVFKPAPVDPGYFNGAAVPLATRTDSFRANARQVLGLRPHVVEMSSRYAEITVPVEILHGTADTTVWPNIHAEPLSELLPDAQLTLLEGIGHAPHHVAPLPVVDAIDRLATRAGLR